MASAPRRDGFRLAEDAEDTSAEAAHSAIGKPGERRRADRESALAGRGLRAGTARGGTRPKTRTGQGVMSR